MIRRYWIVRCDYCGREHKFPGNTKPSDQTLRDSGLIVRGMNYHYCNAACYADANHDAAIKKAGNLKQFQ